MPRAWRILLENRLAAKVNAGEALGLFMALLVITAMVLICVVTWFLTTTEWTDPRPAGELLLFAGYFPRLTTGFLSGLVHSRQGCMEA